MYIAKTSGQNCIQILSETLLDALGFWLDRIRTLVSIVTDSSHRAMIRKCNHTSACSLIESSFFEDGKDNHETSSNSARSDLRLHTSC